VVRIYVRYTVNHPYKICTMMTVDNALRTQFEHLIVDSGVNRFFKKLGLKDYPKYYLERYRYVAEWLYRKYGDRVWVTIPDYPSDYRENPIENNTEKTIRNIEKFIDAKANWIIVIQAKYLDYEDYRRALKLYSDLFPDYPRIAIGTLCTRAPRDYAVFCARMTREYFPKSWIHVFGPSLTVLRYIAPYVNSIDTAGYYSIPHWLRGKKLKFTEEEIAKSWIQRAEDMIARSKTRSLVEFLQPATKKQ